MNEKRIRQYGITIGEGTPGERNSITDVPGVKVGHCTIDTPQNKTGVTVVVPSEENIFVHQLPAAAYVMNGFGKTLGLVQIEELGTVETPIALTNTLNVGLVHDALVEYTINRCAKEGVLVKSVNPVVGETNDCLLNNIAQRGVTGAHVAKAFAAASEDFAQGDVGAGKGTVCYGMKGGIGSASRKITIGSTGYTLGVLVQSNFGKCDDFMLNGQPLGKKIGAELNQQTPSADKGSIMIVMATDLPLTARQIGRVLKRGALGLARTGSYGGHGSGDVMIGFSTANAVVPSSGVAVYQTAMLAEPLLDKAFRAMVESVEEAVLNSMVAADSVTGYDGTVRLGFAPFLEKYWQGQFLLKI